MFRKLLLPVLAFLLLLACLFFYFRLRKAKEETINALRAIPADAALIVEAHQVRGLYTRLSGSNLIWQDLVQTQDFSTLNRNLHYLDSLTATTPSLSEQLEGSTFYFSLHPSGSGWAWLCCCALPETGTTNSVEEFFKSKFSIGKKSNGVNSISTSTRSEVCYYAISKGALLLSASEVLLKRALEQSKSVKSLLDDKAFASVKATAKSARFDLRFYFNYAQGGNLFKSHLNEESDKSLGEPGEFAGWTELDAGIRPKTILMNGYTDPGTDKNYLSLFLGQAPQHPEIFPQLPSNTASFIFYGYSDFRSFSEKYSAVRPQDAVQFIDSLNKRYDLDIQNEFSSWIENETAIAVTEPLSPNELASSSFTLFRSDNIEKAEKSLTELSDLISKRDSIHTDTAIAGVHHIHELRIPGLIRALFGKHYPSAQTWYTSCGNYILFGNSSNALKEYMRLIDHDHTLDREKGFPEFIGQLGSSCNVFIYSHIARSTDIYQHFASATDVEDMLRNHDLFIRFGAVGLQFSSQGKLMSTSACVEENPIYKKEASTLWEARLDTTLSQKPRLLVNHVNNTLDLFVQDDANKIYLISNTGKILWSRQLDEKLCSDPVQIDMYKNHKLQMVFNTRSRIYLMDRNGKDLEGFPVKLPSASTNSLAVMDYDHKSEYRILIACADHIIRNYTTRGKGVDGWKLPKTEDTLSAPIQHCSLSNKDYLIAADTKGRVSLYDRHGELRNRLKEQLPVSLTDFYLSTGKDLAHTWLIASDTAGAVCKLSLAGKKETLSFKKFKNKPSFICRDINSDHEPEFILADRNEVNVFKSDKTLLFNHTFEDTLSSGPLFFRFPDGYGRIGVISSKTDELYLFNESGAAVSGFPFKGRNPFNIGDLNRDNTLILITSEGKNIYAYPLP